MSFRFDQEAISAEINKILNRAHSNTEMCHLIQCALNANSKSGELFQWANLSLLSCECVGGEPQTGLSGAIAMELFALAADILDDLQKARDIIRAIPVPEKGKEKLIELVEEND